MAPEFSFLQCPLKKMNSQCIKQNIYKRERDTYTEEETVRDRDRKERFLHYSKSANFHILNLIQEHQVLQPFT